MSNYTLVSRPAFSGLGADETKLLGGRYTITPTADPKLRSKCFDTKTGQYVQPIICEAYMGQQPTSTVKVNIGEGIAAGLTSLWQQLLPQPSAPMPGQMVAPAPSRPSYLMPVLIGVGVIGAVLLLKKK